MIPFLLLLQATAGPVSPVEERFGRCVALARSAPEQAVADAETFRLAGGGWRARQCAGIAQAALGRFTSAASEFEAGARDAEVAKAADAARLWAQAGNAWLAAGEASKARVALDAALAAGTLTGLALGEAHLDRARALVATGDLAPARTEIDAALTTAAADPLTWLLSATLARRQNELPRASKDIAEALRRSADDAAVQLEAGNIAAMRRDEAGARDHWTRAATIAPGTPAATAAREALAQFDAPAP